MRTLPWVREVKSRYASQGFAVVGIHTPEFDHERRPEAVRNAVERHRLDYPHLLDDDYAYWEALGNEYWPTLYLVDRCGRIRMKHAGEVHAGQESGRTVESRLRTLLDERADCLPSRSGVTPQKPK